MDNIIPPKYIRTILVTLQSRGHQAYLVGGCVRDMLVGVQPNGWGICSSALPEDIVEVFPGCAWEGPRRGTVTIKLNSHVAHVHTFRSDGSYAAHMEPDMHSFVGDLTTDLSRRDFTMNAIALSPDGLVADPFGGGEDIEKQLIRCVGDPRQRFEEDALRMFRAFRFSARLGFSISPDTLEAMKDRSRLVWEIDPPRIRDELEKILVSRAPETVFELFRMGLMNRFVPAGTEFKPEEDSLGRLPRKSLLRWACLAIMLETQWLIPSPEEFLTELCLDERTIRCAQAASDILRRPCPGSPLEWKRLLSRSGVEAAACAAACGDVLRGENYTRELKAVLKSGECFSLKHLAVTAEDLLNLGLREDAIEEMLSFLLDYVIEYPMNNQKSLLLSIAKGTEE